MEKPGVAAAGFTLPEMLVTLVIAGVLASVAVPGYAEHWRRARRVEAESALAGMAAAMERDYVRANSYCGAVAGTSPGCQFIGLAEPANYPATVPPGASAEAARYRLRIAALGDASYELRAVPVAPDRCGTLVLGSSGARSVLGAAPGWDAARCWH